MSNRIAPKLLAELIGTFAFVFIGAGASAVVGDAVGLPGIAAIALAHGRDHVVLAPCCSFEHAVEGRTLVAVLGAADPMVAVLLHDLPATALGHGQQLAPCIVQWWSRQAATSANGIARELTARKLPAVAGGKVWSAAQVQRLLKA